MSKSLEKWFDFLKDRPLPALAPVGIRIQQQLNNLNSSQQDFAELLFFDPGMAVELFRGLTKLPKIKEPILTLSHAISMVGLKPLQVAALRMPSIERLPEIAREGMRLCYSRAIHAGYYGRCWGLRLGLHLPEEIGLAALIDECAEMSLWANAPQQMLAINERRARGLTTEDAAFGVLGTSLNRLSMALAEYWGLPPLTAESLDRNVYEARPLCAQLASHFARTTDTTWVNHKSALLVELCSDFLDMTEDDFLAFAHQLAAELARDAWFTGLPMMIHHLPMVVGWAGHMHASQPPSPSNGPRGSEGKAPELQAPTKNRGQVQAREPLPAQEAVQESAAILEELGPNEQIGQPVPSEATIKPVPATIQQADPKGPDSGHPNGHDKVATPDDEKPCPFPSPRGRGGERALRDFHAKAHAQLYTGAMKLLIHLNKHLNLPRCLFARLHPDGTLRVEAQAGINQTPLRAFHYSTNNKLFTALLHKPVGLWLNKTNRAQYQSLLPVSTQGIWSPADIFLMSVFCHGKPLGLIYADANGQSLDQASYNGFRLRVARFSQLLEEQDLCPTTNPEGKQQ